MHYWGTSFWHCSGRGPRFRVSWHAGAPQGLGASAHPRSLETLLSRSTDPRQLAREAALQMIYAVELGGQSAAEVERWYVQSHPLEPAVREAAGQLLERFSADRAQIDAVIARHLRDWRIERLSVIDRSLLKLATAELLTGTQPVAVIISEALRLARKFSHPEALNFINGVLDAVARELKPA